MSSTLPDPVVVPVPQGTKFTIREVKKRSANANTSTKNETLPRRFLSSLGLGSRSSKSSNTPTIEEDFFEVPGRLRKNEKHRKPSEHSVSTLSIFKGSDGHPWNFDIDAYGIYMDYHNPFSKSYNDLGQDEVFTQDVGSRWNGNIGTKRPRDFEDFEEKRSIGCGSGLSLASASNLKSLNKCKSLSRVDFNNKSADMFSNESLPRSAPPSGPPENNQNHKKQQNFSSLGMSILQKSRPRPKLQSSTFTQCFGLNLVNTANPQPQIQQDPSKAGGFKPSENSSDKIKTSDPAGNNSDSDSICGDHCDIEAYHVHRGTTNKLPKSPKKQRPTILPKPKIVKKLYNIPDENQENDNEDEDEDYYPSDTSYDKACGSIRRNSAPLTPLLGQSQSTARETQSRFANFFSKRSFKSNPLKRTKSVTKLERKKASGPEPESNSLLYQSSRLRTSRSHESLLTWTNHSNFVNGMMSTLDLTAGDVAIRALHSSILGEDYAFQVITGNGGAKYYTCSSAAERDSWVHALQQSIKPYADEVRRCENSLKIWILEAKNVLGGKSRKRFFCELYLDEVLYSRTCGKSYSNMVFWGELFEFMQLPNCVSMITVVLFREGDKKRKKERNTCLGKVKIPVSAVNSRSLIEKWYPVEPNSINNKDSPKDWPSIRIKCKFQSVDILPLRCYSPFLQYVKDEYGPVCESLESVLSVKAKEELASALVHVLHHENLAKDFISEISLQEILKSGDEKLTFRGNSIATKAMEAFLKLTGSEYLHTTLGAFIETFQVSEEKIDCEIDPMKLTQSANLAKNQQNLRMAVEHVWKCILHSATIFPLELRECFSHCREALKSAGKEDLSDHLISASIFLRFLCPAILSPSLFSITNEYPSEKAARNLTLIAKVLQTLANFTRFQGKENYMEFINDFLEKEAKNMKEFLSTISSPLSEDTMRKIRKEKEKQVPAGGFIDLAKYLSILSTVLSECVGKILKSNDRFKSLQDLLETIHVSLKMPANHFTSALPFPHLNSPAVSQSTTPQTPNPPSSFANLKLNRISLSGIGVQGQQTPIINHQNQQNNGPYQTPAAIYAVSNANPNVKNISTKPLQLQIPNSNGNSSGGSSSSSAGGQNNNNRSGSQASSGYQSQSPILENDDKNKKEAVNGVNMQAMINHANILNNNLQNKLVQERVNNNNNIIKVLATPQTQVTSVFYRKIGSQSVDDLTSVGTTDLNREQNSKKRLTRSSSSSDEYEPGTYSLNKNRALLKHNAFNGQQNASDPKQFVDSKSQRKGNKSIQMAFHQRLHRKSSADLLRRSYPYSSSTEEDSDSAMGHSRESNSHSREEAVPQLPPRRSHAKRNSARPIPDEEKTLEEYEREMDDLRRGMEELQAKLNRAEKRLFGGQESQPQSPQIQIFHQHPVQQHSPKIHMMSHYANQPKSSPSPPIPLHNNELLSALDKKQKLIDQQEQKIARLDSVNNQLLEALAQIRDSLQQQHLQAQQQKIQLQVQKQQQHLQALTAEIITPNYPNGYSQQQYRQPQMSPNSYLYHQSHNGNNININGGAGDNYSQHHNPQQVLYSNGHLQHAQIPYVQRQMYHNNNQPPPPQYPQVINKNNNTTKVLITSEAHSNNNGNGNISRSPSEDSLEEDSSSILGEKALQMLAELKSSSC